MLHTEIVTSTQRSAKDVRARLMQNIPIRQNATASQSVGIVRKTTATLPARTLTALTAASILLARRAKSIHRLRAWFVGNDFRVSHEYSHPPNPFFFRYRLHYFASATYDDFYLRKGPPPKIRAIQRAVCGFFGVTLIDMLSHRRHQDVIMPRQIAMYIARNATERSLPEIAREFGGRDHTTALHAIRKIDRLIKTDEKVRSDVAAIKSILGVV